MASKVFLARTLNGEPVESVAEKAAGAFDAAGFAECLRADDFVALKGHIGEKGSATFVKPAVYAALGQSVRAAGARPFLTDTTTLYVGHRSNALDYLQTALEHGFTIDSTGAPLVISDGLRGDGEIEVPVAGKHYERALLAADIVRANAMIVVSHVTGHVGIGVGATLKNLAMGCASRKGKLAQHSDMKPTVDPEKCTRCGQCQEWCPTGAARQEGDQPARIDHDACIGCGECLTVCRPGAISAGWDTQGKLLQEKIVEYALAVVSQKRDRIGFLNVAIDMTKDCDCFGIVQKPVVPDVGIVASLDPVALDKATLDLVEETAGKPFRHFAHAHINDAYTLEYAEGIGLGSRDYDLVEIA